MGNRTPEQDLIDAFVSSLQEHDSPDLKIEKLLNSNCKAKKLADIEYISVSGSHWVIEAKSNDSSDAHNTVHKIFGELLKETGRESRENSKISVLIPENGVSFYSRLFQSVNREKFLGFGSLVPVQCVFTFGASGVRQIGWAELYDYH